MQKKKPSFQVIPNYGVGEPQNWNESKEVPAEQGRNGSSRRSVPTAAGLFCSVDRDRQTVEAISPSGPNSQPPHMRMVRRNGVVLA
jgi:hypothetical protein